MTAYASFDHFRPKLSVTLGVGADQGVHYMEDWWKPFHRVSFYVSFLQRSGELSVYRKSTRINLKIAI